MFSTRIFLDYFSGKQIITRLELDPFPSLNITLIPFPKPAFLLLLQTVCSAPWPGTSLTLSSPIVPKSCLFDFGLILISTSKLASTPVLLEELEIWRAFSPPSFCLCLYSQQRPWTWTLPLPLLNSLMPCRVLHAPIEWPGIALRLLIPSPRLPPALPRGCQEPPWKCKSWS